MIDAGYAAGRDPRLNAASDDLGFASVRSAPEVGRTASAAEGLGLAVGVIGAAALGGLTMLSLSHHRQPPAAKPAPPVAAARPAPAPVAPPAPVVRAAAPVPTVAPAAAAPASVLVLDSSAPPAPPAPAAAKGASTSAAAAAGAAKTPVYFSQDEQFAARAGDEAVPTSHAKKLEHPDKIIAQGTVIPAVLETALNSDLPGYTRALVSRDVRSFDGSQVLIPRGSRLIGQYKSALQTGQSRAMIIWSRLLRPDGVSMQLGSPVIDNIGEAGLAGKVDSHFVQRFGSAILLSVVGGLASAAGGSNNNTLVIGTATQSSGAASVALQNDIKISPTVRVMQGAAIQVFAARDLDFSDEGP
jgi:type IV secretion system protein VirB10